MGAVFTFAESYCFNLEKALTFEDGELDKFMYNRIKGLMHASLIEAYIQRLILLLLTQPKIFKQKI